MTLKAVLAGFALTAAACGGHHTAADPSSTPIAAVTTDAVYVVNGEDSSITVIDATSEAVVGVIALVNIAFPHHIYLSANGATMLVADPGSDLSGGHTGGGHGEGGGAVLVMDAATGAVVRARRLDAPNHNAIFAPDASIWTAQAGTPGRVLVLDPATLATRSEIVTQNDPAEVTFSGSRAFVANTASDSVTAIDAASGNVLATIPVGDAPVGAWPASNGRLYVDNEAGQSLSVIDAATLAVTDTFALGFTPALAALAPNGEIWVTDTDSGKLVFLRASDGMKLGDVSSGAGAHAIAFNGDGTKAFVTNQTANTVAVIDVATKTVTTTVPVGGKPNGIVFRDVP